jgi:hypothetical protein
MDPAVQSYIEAIPARQRPLFDRLESLILELYPDAETMISYGIPTYKVGRRRVYMGLWKGGVSVHGVRVEDFKQRHPAIKTGKGSLNLAGVDRLGQQLRVAEGVVVPRAQRADRFTAPGRTRLAVAW